ncbi:MAG: CxxxxCH/CxxCH domain c-type cytochrome [Desulfuromonadaceae bacterium]
MNRMVITLLTALVFSLSLFDRAEAVTVEQPHEFTCAECHTSHKDLGSTGYDNICLTCHRSGDPRAGAKSFAPGDAADPFGKYTSGINNSFQISHRWDGSATNPRAGAAAPVQPQMTSVSRRTSNSLACVSCHNQHSQANKPFLRMANDSDQMCLDCHSSRNQTNHTKGTHPVGVVYQQDAADFHQAPVNANPANPTSALKLVGGKVSCSTCHGVHATDSNSATFDAFSSLPGLKPSDGFLLRTDLKAATADGINICTNCHTGKIAHNGGGQNVQCTDCHGAHVDLGDGTTPNVWLVKRDMGVGRGTVQFTSTAPENKNYMDAKNTGVCQSCHAVPTGSGFPFHPTQANANANATCNDCHVHGNSKGSFSALGACNACHGYPPLLNSAGAGGYASGYQSTASFVDESQSGHGSHASSPYQKACENCHKGNSHQAGTFQDVFKDTVGTVAATGGLNPAYNGTAQTCSNVYCHSNANPRGGTNSVVITPSWKNGKGKIIGTADECNSCHSAAGKASPTWSVSHTRHINGYAANSNFTCNTCHAATASGNGAIFSNMTARSLHTNGVKDITFNSFAQGGTWNESVASCANVYCHSNVQGAGGSGAPAANMVTWNSAAMTCGSCHAAMTKMGNISTATGSHKRHVQVSGFECATCHGAQYSASSSSVNTATHVDRSITMALTGTAATNGAVPVYYQGNNSPGGGYDKCSNVYCHSNVQGTDGSGKPTKFTDPLWGAPPLVCGSCHASMATDAAATGSHVSHAQTAQYGCQTCHNGAGKNTVKHASGFIDFSFSGSAAGTAYSNGSAVTPGKGYGSCSTNCHGQGTPAWGATYVVPGTTFPYSASQCDKCHSGTAAAPFYSTATPNKVTATTNTKVGAHTSHLTAVHALSTALACADCHGTVTSISAANHMNGSTDFVFSALAKTGGLNPTYTGGQCDNTYCHGTTLTGGSNIKPNWTQTITGCAVCHGFPPTTAKNGTVPHSTSTACNGCHTHVNSTNNGFINPALHINGLVNYSFGACDSCHGYPPARPGFAASAGNWANAKTEDYTYGGGAHTVQSHVNKSAVASEGFDNCNRCHNPADHQMSPIVFKPGDNIKVNVDQSIRFVPAKQAKYTSNRRDGTQHVAGTCSNINCHFGASPAWNKSN